MVSRGRRQRRHRQILAGVVLFGLAFAWYWFWRPYGLWYGGDSEYLDRQVNGGLWFRKREPLAVAAMQLAHQILTLRLGWPVAWSISFASCVAGAVATVVLWRLFRDEKHPYAVFLLTLCSGFVLLFHGSIESYALPTCLLSVWILAVHRTADGLWPSWSIPFAFAGMVWCHVMALFLVPSLILSAWTYRDRLRRGEWAYWGPALVIACWVYVFTNILNIGEGLGFEGATGLFADSVQKEFGPFFSFKHLRIKAYFLWVGTHITFPFALYRIWQKRRDPETQQIGLMAACGLVFVAAVHPDTGYRDWDLFLLPSLPLAVLGARAVAWSAHRRVYAGLWILAFLTVWVPRVPIWAKLPERGLAEVVILNFPEDRQVRLDNRYPVRSARFKVQGGEHTLSVLKRGYLTTTTRFRISPGERIEVEVPVTDEQVPFADRIRRLEEEGSAVQSAD